MSGTLVDGQAMGLASCRRSGSRRRWIILGNQSTCERVKRLPRGDSSRGSLSMPPISTQGSRAGLVSGLVVFTILFVTSTIFAIYFNVQFQKTMKDFNDYKKQYNGVVADTAFTTPQFSALMALRSAPDSGFSQS